jgi:hypothetical protein
MGVQNRPELLDSPFRGDDSKNNKSPFFRALVTEMMRKESLPAFFVDSGQGIPLYFFHKTGSWKGHS